ncbi:M20 family metallopeptidase [Eubacterium sp. AB3007]|uniref:M20 family metallopeptidase n=1 Tax=Eubacterium sp. AB3007 TaxID=1392487 RepID=UPI0005513804|nr:M20 family metallopeptidase [Eubacterium sp. AB3007]
MEYAEMKESIEEVIEGCHGEFAKMSDDLFDHPELSGEEYASSERIVTKLVENGFVAEYPFDGIETAFRAICGNNDHQYKVAIMAEYDALPEIGHACGHCLSAAISCLAGVALSDLQEALDTDIHVIGTPAEEIDGAKCKMVQDGVFDDYDMAIMVHLYNQNLVRARLLALRSDMYTFHGKAAHASAAPWEGINALNAVQLAFHGVDMLRQHVKPDVRIHGVIHEGGKMPGVVPERAAAEFYVRALQRDYMEEVNKKVENCIKGACLATGTTYDVHPTAETYADLRPNQTGEDALREVFGELDIPDNGDYEAVFGSADAGNVSYVCPTFHPCLQLTPQEVVIHTREFAKAVRSDHAHDVMRQGAALIALTIAKIFSDEERVQQMKRDFENA